jgi:hypothetical protein
MMDVMIGVDPHKGSHTATMLDRGERELTRVTVRAGRPPPAIPGSSNAWAADVSGAAKAGPLGASATSVAAERVRSLVVRSPGVVGR